MAIEIKQMIIKSTLVSEHGEQKDTGIAISEIETLKQQVMDECKELIDQCFEELKER